MELTLQQLFEGKGTKIKGKDFFPTRAYVEPFIERMSKVTDEFIIQAKLPDQITYTNEGELNTDDITFNRVYIQAVLPDELTVSNHKEVIGMVYGIDVRKPVCKFFNNVINMACTNLCVFSPNLLEVQEMEEATPINYKPLDKLQGQTEEICNTLTRLQNSTFECTTQNINESLGKWIRNTMHLSYDNGFGKVKLAASVATDAYKKLFEDEDSPYYVQDWSGGTSMFNVYNSFTEIIKDQRSKEILNEYEKVLLVKGILELHI